MNSKLELKKIIKSYNLFNIIVIILKVKFLLEF